MVFKVSSLIIAICIAAAVPLMLAFYFKWRRFGTVKFSSLRNVQKIPPTIKHRLRHIPMVLRLLVLGFLLVGFARPRTPGKKSIVSTEGVAIQMVIDRSSSMREEMEFEGERSSRFEVVRKVFTGFVLGDRKKELSGRPSDLLGLTSFAMYPEENCPLTLDHNNLIAFMESIQPVALPIRDRSGMAAPPDDGTAIGDAIYHAVLSLINAEDAVGKSPDAGKNYKIKSKIIILLTDGQQNTGEYLPLEAAEAAKKNGIKIYSIAVVPHENMKRTDTLMGSFYVGGRGRLDTTDIRDAATETGGRFFEATSGESLAEIYKSINALEKSRFSERIADYNDHFQSWWAVPMGLFLLTLEILLRNTWFRTTP